MRMMMRESNPGQERRAHLLPAVLIAMVVAVCGIALTSCGQPPAEDPGQSGAEQSSGEVQVIDTLNQSLEGKEDPATGVRFERKTIAGADGHQLEGVFPVFDAKAEVVLPENMYPATAYEQEKYGIRLLQEQLQQGDLQGFSEGEQQEIRKGRLPRDLAFHPAEERGLLQVVDRDILEETEHTDGTGIWGYRSSFKPELKQGTAYTSRDAVAEYAVKYKELPPNFISKSQARRMADTEGTGDYDDGRNPTENFGSPAHIGGSHFGNYEKRLPAGQEYIECDVDYTDRIRGPRRLVISRDFSQVYYTDDHYQSFTRLY